MEERGGGNNLGRFYSGVEYVEGPRGNEGQELQCALRYCTVFEYYARCVQIFS